MFYIPRHGKMLTTYRYVFFLKQINKNSVSVLTLLCERVSQNISTKLTVATYK